MDAKPEPVKKVAKDRKLGYLLIAAGKDIFKAYGIGVPPGIVLIDKRGIVQVVHAPFAQMTPQQFEQAMKQEPEKVQKIIKEETVKVPEKMKELEGKVKELLTAK